MWNGQQMNLDNWRRRREEGLGGSTQINEGSLIAGPTLSEFKSSPLIQPLSNFKPLYSGAGACSKCSPFSSSLIMDPMTKLLSLKNLFTPIANLFSFIGSRLRYFSYMAFFRLRLDKGVIFSPGRMEVLHTAQGHRS